MAKLLRWLLAIVVLVGLYWWCAVDSRMPADANFPLDLGLVRQLADSVPGDKPTQVRYESVAAFRFPGAMIVAGDPWAWSPMPVYAYQVVYADHTAMIDAALDQSIAPPDFITTSFDGAAYQRMQQALDKAALIVITHEHMDHIGGVARSPHLAALLPALRLTDVQLAHPERMKPAVLPADVLASYKPLHYDHYDAIAPGMVLIAAPGHTPGSQMVYVKLADGRELLFLGDVVWHMRNIEVQRERPRWVTGLLVQEDREQVFGEIKALHDLTQRAPGVRLVPGHDGDAIAALTAAGYLEHGFTP